MRGGAKSGWGRPEALRGPRARRQSSRRGTAFHPRAPAAPPPSAGAPPRPPEPRPAHRRPRPRPPEPRPARPNLPGSPQTPLLVSRAAGTAGRVCGLQPRRPERAARTMPRIDADLKLDFKDVLLRPKRSSLKSRAEVGPLESRIGVGLFVFFRGGAGEVGESRCTVRPPRLLFSVSRGGWDATPSALLTTGERENQLVSCQDRRCL